MMKLGTKIAAVTFVLLAAGPALAGKGGSAAKIQSAVTSGSVDAIVAEIERTESLMCEQCVGIVTNLLEDDRYAVREAAAWWFAKRPALKDMLATQFVTELASGDTIAVRNAADFLGRTMTYTSLPALRTAIVSPEASSVTNCVASMSLIAGRLANHHAAASRTA